MSPVHVPNWFAQIPEPRKSKMLVTLLGKEDDHPIFGLEFSPSRYLNDRDDKIRRIDLEVDRCMMGSSQHSDQTNTGLPRLTQQLDIVNYRLVNTIARTDIFYHVFHGCGGIFDLHDLKSELAEGNRQYTEVEHLSCTRCKKTVDVFDVFYDDSGLDSVAKALGATGQKRKSLLQIGRSEQDSLLYALHIDRIPTDFFFRPSFLDEIYSGSGTIHERHSLESLLERLFPDVPAPVMEQLLREIVGKTDATISSLEKEVAFDSLGYSFSDAVGRFTLARSGKSYIIKVMKNGTMAEKEILVATEARKTLPLALYVPGVCVEHPISYKGYHLIVMDDLSQSPLPVDHHKQEALHSIGSKRKGLSDRLVHRLYVANLFHRSLAHLASHPLLSDLGVPQYIDGSQLQERLDSYSSAGGKKLVGKAYDASVAFLVDLVHDSSLIVHNDMREPNWVRHCLLDFGCSSRADKGGGVYRDIVRILLAEKDRRIFDPAYIHQVVNCYYAFHDFEEHQRMPSKTSRDMQKEYTLTFAQLSTEAPRHIGISWKYSSPECRQQELDWYHAVAVFAQREFLKRTEHLC